ncbi:hypothetical protein RFI_07909 [Reticulomyxa filosa]|uniref:Uncharacterized protein n=1 Tax=Reticulomyxa filosa TaxID=46433 RepID=X6NVA6_RETFI|nr:hypothetical protein RFI_07909 [Reticulomyxa filosa]|eukprot:ETO29217.1 hypothetical protein RFI_07909 [Reticulomyxa filosa]
MEIATSIEMAVSSPEATSKLQVLVEKASVPSTNDASALTKQTDSELPSQPTSAISNIQSEAPVSAAASPATTTTEDKSDENKNNTNEQTQVQPPAKTEEPVDPAKLALENEINQIKKLIKEWSEYPTDPHEQIKFLFCRIVVSKKSKSPQAHDMFSSSEDISATETENEERPEDQEESASEPEKEKEKTVSKEKKIEELETKQKLLEDDLLIPKEPSQYLDIDDYLEKYPSRARAGTG